MVDTSLRYCEEVVGGVLVRLYEMRSPLSRCFALFGACLDEARVLGVRQHTCLLTLRKVAAYDMVSLLFLQLCQSIVKLFDV